MRIVGPFKFRGLPSFGNYRSAEHFLLIRPFQNIAVLFQHGGVRQRRQLQALHGVMENINVLGLPQGVLPTQKNGGPSNVAFGIAVDREQPKDGFFEVA